MFRSQGGPLSSVPFTCFPTSPLSRIDSSAFRVLLLRRLWLPLPPSSRSCRCGRLLDVLGHRAGCAEAGVLGRRGFVLESAAARVCREAGARVTTNVMIRDLDLLPMNHVDARRLEVVADGLPLFHGAQVAVDTTLVSPLRRDGTPHVRCAGEDGAALFRPADGKSEHTLSTQGNMEEPGWWFWPARLGRGGLPETQSFLRQLVKAKTRHVPRILQTSARMAWIWRWSMILACASARAFAQSLLERRGLDGPTPTIDDVIREARYAGFA